MEPVLQDRTLCPVVRSLGFFLVGHTVVPGARTTPSPEIPLLVSRDGCDDCLVQSVPVLH